MNQHVWQQRYALLHQLTHLRGQISPCLLINSCSPVRAALQVHARSQVAPVVADERIQVGGDLRVRRAAERGHAGGPVRGVARGEVDAHLHAGGVDTALRQMTRPVSPSAGLQHPAICVVPHWMENQLFVPLRRSSPAPAGSHSRGRPAPPAAAWRCASPGGSRTTGAAAGPLRAAERGGRGRAPSSEDELLKGSLHDRPAFARCVVCGCDKSLSLPEGRGRVLGARAAPRSGPRRRSGSQSGGRRPAPAGAPGSRRRPQPPAAAERARMCRPRAPPIAVDEQRWAVGQFVRCRLPPRPTDWSQIGKDERGAAPQGSATRASRRHA